MNTIAVFSLLLAHSHAYPSEGRGLLFAAGPGDNNQSDTRTDAAIQRVLRQHPELAAHAHILKNPVIRPAAGSAQDITIFDAEGETIVTFDADVDAMIPPARRDFQTGHRELREGIIDNDDRRSVYGDEVKRSPFNSVVRIENWDGSTCSGTLVANDVVLTSAHCIYDRDWKWPKYIELHPTKHTIGVECSEKRVTDRWQCGTEAATCTFKVGRKSLRWGGWKDIMRTAPDAARCGTQAASCIVQPDESKCAWRYTANHMMTYTDYVNTCGRCKSWTCNCNTNEHDIAAIRLNKDTAGKHAGDRAGGWKTAKTAWNLQGKTLRLSGYPSDKEDAGYNRFAGLRATEGGMWTAEGQVTFQGISINGDRNNAVSNMHGARLKHTIDAAEGCSGGGLDDGDSVYGVGPAINTGFNEGAAITSWFKDWMDAL